MKRHRVLFGTCGIVGVVVFVAFGGLWSWPVAGQAPRDAAADLSAQPRDPLPTITSGPVVPARYQVPQGVGNPSTAPGPIAPLPPLSENIDELFSRLDAIKAQKLELDKAEKETVDLLRDKLKQQKQRLQKLGVTVEDNGTPLPSASPAPQPGSTPAPIQVSPPKP